MNRPGLVTRRPNQASLSSRRRRALLRVILLPLDIVESADPVPVAAVDEVEPFLPACISAPSATGDDGPHAQLLAFRHIVDRSSPPIAFGLALDGQRAPDGPQRRYVGPPATCLSLWEVPGNGLVLACEELTPDRAGSLIDRHNDPLRGGGSPEFWAAIEAFLRPFGLTTEASPIDVFPRLDTRLPRSEVYRPLRSLTIHGPNWTGRDTLEGLIIEVHTDGVDTVQRLDDEPGTTPSAGAASRSYRGLLGWHRVPLIDRASRLGSGIAIREDARALAVDLGSPATGPGHLDRGTREMVYCLIGWVALRAQHSADHRRVLSLLRNRRQLSERGALAGLGDIAAARRRMIETRLLQTHPAGAHRPPRIESTHLRSTLANRTADEIAVLHTELGKLCDSAESCLLPHTLASARDRRSTLVSVAAAGALFATSLHAAVAASPEYLQRWGFTVAVTAAIGAVALLDVGARRRPGGTLTKPTPVAPPRASPAVTPVRDLERRRRESIFPFETQVWRTAPSRRGKTPTLRECLEANDLSGCAPSNPPLVAASSSSRPAPKWT